MKTVDSAPAGGAAVGEVIAATGGALIATAVLLYLGWAHRTGRSDLLRRLTALAARDTRFAPWAALPSVVAMGALLVALLGMYWDISLHIDEGRDSGPLANPAHYLILIGLFGIFAAGFLAIVLPEGKPSSRAVRISGDWYAPLGGIAMIAAAAFALIGFPLDDIWHRIFGQDVTLWGPTHLMLIGGAGLTLIGSAILIVEGRSEPAPGSAGGGAPASLGRAVNFAFRYRGAFAVGGLLIGLSTFQAEFDFGVPQFQLVLEPIMLAFAAGIALVAARVWIGPGAALGAAIFFVCVRGIVALIVGQVFGEATPHLPLYLAEALCVEGLAFVVSTRRTYLFGALSGALIATVGFAAEYGWSHVWMPVPWPESLIAETIVAVLFAGIGAGLLGAFLGASLEAGRGRGRRPRRDRRRRRAQRRRPDAERLARERRSAQRERRPAAHRGRDDPPRPARDRRRGLLGERGLVAGRRPGRRPPRAGRPRRLPHHRAAPRVRDLEDAGPAPPRQLRRRRPDLHARGQRDPGARRPGEAALHALVRG